MFTCNRDAVMVVGITNLSVDGVGSVDCDQLWWFVDVAVAVLVDEHNGERGGGFLNLRDANGKIVFEYPFRSPSSNKTQSYREFAREKTSRLEGYPEHVLSWQSKNEALQQYQGAVRAPNGLLGSFSGFTGEEDETIILWAFTKMEFLSGKEAYQAAQISSNSRYAYLVQKFNQAEKAAD